MTTVNESIATLIALALFYAACCALCGAVNHFL